MIEKEKFPSLNSKKIDWKQNEESLRNIWDYKKRTSIVLSEFQERTKRVGLKKHSKKQWLKTFKFGKQSNFRNSGNGTNPKQHKPKEVRKYN